MTQQFQTVGLWGRLAEAQVAEPALHLGRHLIDRGLDVYVASGPAGDEALDDIRSLDDDELHERLDLLIVIGGDGTLLRAARLVAGADLPLVGINRGRLGFLTDILPDDMLASVDAILAGDYLEEDRTLLEARIVGAAGGPKRMIALNDVVLQRGDPGHLLDFETSVDGSFVNTHGADGLVIATSTGSTAYALSCGGPIIRPDVDALVMVPICPHTLSDRPLVLKTSSVIEARIQSPGDRPAYVSCDGEELGELRPGATLQVRAAAETVKLLHPTHYNYYDLLRSKLNWGRANRGRKSAG
jgi:NAD+ kinase